MVLGHKSRPKYQQQKNKTKQKQKQKNKTKQNKQKTNKQTKTNKKQANKQKTVSESLDTSKNGFLVVFLGVGLVGVFEWIGSYVENVYLMTWLQDWRV